MVRTLVFSLSMIGLAGASPAMAQAAGAAPAPAQDAAGKGAAVFAAQKCSMCHSLDGKGSAKGPLDGVGLKLKPEEIRQWIVAPVDMAAKAKATRKPAMKAYPNLAKDDLDALVAFMSSQKKKS
jgi:mono/diheme cytochrome c family protein